MKQEMIEVAPIRQTETLRKNMRNNLNHIRLTNPGENRFLRCAAMDFMDGVDKMDETDEGGGGKIVVSFKF